jgi:glycosyltransferase involved in cell wall biosynthesis
MAEQTAIPIVHVTDFNAHMWDNGRARTEVIEHGIPDPGLRYEGRLPRVGYVVNEPLRRNRIVGADLVGHIASEAPVDVFGIGTRKASTRAHDHEVIGHGDVAHGRMHELLALRRVYVHLCRWTSLGLSLLEAMALGMPIVTVATTQAPESLAGSGAVVTNNIERLRAAVRLYIHDSQAARAAGRRARDHYLAHFTLARFHDDWERLLKEVL